jgi:hypothetical protein
LAPAIDIGARCKRRPAGAKLKRLEFAWQADEEAVRRDVTAGLPSQIRSDRNHNGGVKPFLLGSLSFPRLLSF